MILDKLPSPDEFYKTYWAKAPFIVRGGVDKALFDECVTPEELAGLSLEEDIKSRIVITDPNGQGWRCDHGPFEDDRFTELGATHWSLLVQNVEQYHTDTAKLLGAFQFSPRWLMDDIMVSYSTTGGSVGPHTDSYHVFLVQGTGQRRWKVSNTPIENETYIEGLDLKVLKDPFDGQEVEVSAGDVIYIPPHYAHEGVTLENAMTFSVGFLGPTLPEMMIEYGHYLEQNQAYPSRYIGNDLDANSAALTIAPQAQQTLQGDILNAVESDHFASWMTEYFSASTHGEDDVSEEDAAPISRENLLSHLKDGLVLRKQGHIKAAITQNPDGTVNLSVYGACLPTSPGLTQLAQWLNDDKGVSIADIEAVNDDTLMDVITDLYNQNILR